MRKAAVALLTMIVSTGQASAATIPTYGRIDAFEAALYELFFTAPPPNDPNIPIPELRDSDTFPVLFSVAGHVDTDSLTFTIDQILANGPTGGLSFTTVSGTPVTWEWGSDWDLVPLSMSTTSTFPGVFSIFFEPITLGTLTSGGPGQDLVKTPALRVECLSSSSCTSFLLITDGFMTDVGSVRLILDDVLGSTPEPSAALLALLGIGAAARQRVGLQPARRSSAP